MTSSASTRRTTTAPSASTHRSRQRRHRRSVDRRQRRLLHRHRRRRRLLTLERRHRVPRVGRMLRSSNRCCNKRVSNLIQAIYQQTSRKLFKLSMTAKFFSVLVRILSFEWKMKKNVTCLIWSHLIYCNNLGKKAIVKFHGFTVPWKLFNLTKKKISCSLCKSPDALTEFFHKKN